MTATDDELPAPSARLGLIADSSERFRVRRLREWAKDSFWVLPSLFLVAAVALGFSLREIDGALGVAPGGGPWWVGTPEAASDILATIATAILTFLGVVFSITLVALQLASQQFSPRVTRTFVRSTTTKLALGTFAATFVVSLLALSGVERASGVPAEVPVASVTTSLLLVGASLVVFVVFVNSTTRLIRIAHIVGAVADETRDAIDANHPPAGRYVEVAGPVDPGTRSAPAPVPPPGRRRRFARRHGNVVLAVDAGRLVQLARRHDCVLELVPRVGEYVGTGRPLYRVYGDDRPSDVELQRLTQLGRERTLYQDPAYGIRQLVDIAAQALSPAINAPTTAVQVIDRLADLLGEIGGRPDPTGLVLDRDRRLRLLVPVAGWPSLVELAFTEIRTFGARSPQVSRRLAAALSDLSDVLPAERRAPLERQRALLFETLALPGGEPGERVEDRLGLG